jgi:ketosteroid isomerase-like protein
MAKKTTEEVLQHHAQALFSHNLDGIVEDYTKDSVFFLPTETFKGLDGIKAGFTAVTKMLTPEVAANFKVIKQEISGDYVYTLWSSPPTFPFGGETFYIHNGKILMQSFVGQTKS